CGMAGSFGFETEKYALSAKSAGRALLPALNEAAPEAMAPADGFSRREQIEQRSAAMDLKATDLRRAWPPDCGDLEPPCREFMAASAACHGAAARFVA
ncbi:MAG: hypothetical protein ACREFQ_17850, partial [Stellaceae bacterium]